MLNDGPRSAPNVALHPHLDWLSEVLGTAGLIRSPGELLRNGAGPDTRTFYLADKRSDHGNGLVVRFHGGPNAISREWPGEVTFYETLPRIALPVPETVAVFRDRGASRACVVLRDLRATHRRAWDSEGDAADARSTLIRTVARLHAEWWPSRGLREGAGRSPFGMEALIQRDRTVVARAAEIVSRMAHVDPATVQWMETLLERAVFAKQARMMAGGPLTRVHGSPSLGGLWLPRDGEEDRVRLTDWDDWRIDLWAGDLARLLMDDTSGSLSPEDVLPAYRTALREHGIDDYPESEMASDVAASIPFEMAVGILQGRATVSRTAHWRRLADRFR